MAKYWWTKMYVGQCSLNCFHSLVQIFYSYFQFLVWNIVLLSDFWGFFFNGGTKSWIKIGVDLMRKKKKKTNDFSKGFTPIMRFNCLNANENHLFQSPFPKASSSPAAGHRVLATCNPARRPAITFGRRRLSVACKSWWSVIINGRRRVSRKSFLSSWG